MEEPTELVTAVLDAIAMPKGQQGQNEKAVARWENEGGARKKRPRDAAQLAKLIVDIATGEVEDREPTPEERGKNAAAAELGRKGGQARARALSTKQKAEIAKKGANSRWRRGHSVRGQKEPT